MKKIDLEKCVTAMNEKGYTDAESLYRAQLVASFIHNIQDVSSSDAKEVLLAALANTTNFSHTASIFNSLIDTYVIKE